MNGVWRFVHYFGFAIWVGGALASMIAGMAMKRMDRAIWGAVVDTQAAIYRLLVGPGTILVLLSGIIMTMRMYQGMAGVQMSPWLGTMQGAGLVGALVTLLGAMPAAMRLSRLEPLGASAGEFDRLRKRLAITSSIGGTLALLALLAGALYRAA